MFAALLISGWDWLWPAAAILAAALALVAWVYRREIARTPVRALCAGLKIAAFLLLALCLLDPRWTGRRARPGANLFVVLADNSQSMGVKDPTAPLSRAETLRGLLIGEKQTWLPKIEEDFQLRRYLFDSRLHGSKDFSDLDFNGRASGIGAALKSIASRYQGQPLAGVILLTDGNATDLREGKIETNGLPPVYPVVMGRDDAIQDIGLRDVAISQTAFEDAPVTIQAMIGAAGYASREITATLTDSNGVAVATQTLPAPANDEPIPFRFEIKPTHPGLSFYRLRTSARDELGQFEQPETSHEATLANNTRLLAVDRGKGPYRVLYVTGRPTWEFKFLHRAIDEDDQVQMSALVRIAKREPKFDFRGRKGESSNPLFRGFDNQSPEDTERYDQPVIVRLYTRDENELVGGFPKTAAELYNYHAIVIDHLEAGFFTRDQQVLVQKFVSERGGGLLMLGGAESFREGGYDRTPVGDILPVYLDHIETGPALVEPRLNLTREGWLQPWARLRSSEVAERQRIETMTPFQVFNRVRDVKPGASAIATVRDNTGHDYPALVVQRFGAGRVGALMIGDLWRWGFHDEAAHKDMDKAWRQMFRWLVADVPNRVDLTVEPKSDDPNQSVLLQVRVRDKNFQPMDNVSVALFVRSVTNSVLRTNNAVIEKLASPTNSVRIVAEPSSTTPGLYEAAYIPRETGGYQVEAVVTDSSAAEVGRAETGWTADPAADEFRSLKPNRPLMAELAQKTGGRVLAADSLDAFAGSLPNERAPVTEEWSFPIWHTPYVFLAALACLVAEWGIRRKKGMA